MTKQCIQGDDNLLYSGIVGEHIITNTYNITLGKSNPNIRATIERGSCVPVHLYVNHKVDMSTVDVYNVTPGIKDTKIFDIPPQCKHASPKHRRTMNYKGPETVLVFTFLRYTERNMINIFVTVLGLLGVNAHCHGRFENLIKQMERNVIELKNLRVNTTAFRGHNTATYIRWGKSSCPQDSTLVYDDNCILVFNK
ncbi:unnamed protein product [Mytilus edulis]|uniref:Uncharacterized protein n=1 Tax=Mytilus edulis TaxID=6550 RepID=A0A8S3UBF3_MYTED|nr:unnamed protein product [Mytilus edulis]